MTRLYEFTNGTTTFMLNMEQVIAITRTSGDGVIITMVNGSSYNVKMDYEYLKKFLEKQAAVFITETADKAYDDVPF